MAIVRDFARQPPSVTSYLHGGYVPRWPDWKERADGASSWCSTRIDNRVYLLLTRFDIMRGVWNIRLHRRRPDLPHTARSVPWELIADQDFELDERCAAARTTWLRQPSTRAITELRALRLCHRLP